MQQNKQLTLKQFTPHTTQITDNQETKTPNSRVNQTTTTLELINYNWQPLETPHKQASRQDIGQTTNQSTQPNKQSINKYHPAINQNKHQPTNPSLWQTSKKTDIETTNPGNHNTCQSTKHLTTKMTPNNQPKPKHLINKKSYHTTNPSNKTTWQEKSKQKNESIHPSNHKTWQSTNPPNQVKIIFPTNKNGKQEGRSNSLKHEVLPHCQHVLETHRQDTGSSEQEGRLRCGEAEVWRQRRCER